MATALVFGTIVSTVSSFFEGQSIATLPFEPQWMLKTMAHRGLVNPLPNECSFIFLVSLQTPAFENYCFRQRNFVFCLYLIFSIFCRQWRCGNRSRSIWATHLLARPRNFRGWHFSLRPIHVRLTAAALTKLHDM